MGTIMLQVIPINPGISQESNSSIFADFSAMAFNAVASLSNSSLYRSYHRYAYSRWHKRYWR